MSLPNKVGCFTKLFPMNPRGTLKGDVYHVVSQRVVTQKMLPTNKENFNKTHRRESKHASNFIVEATKRKHENNTIALKQYYGSIL